MKTREREITGGIGEGTKSRNFCSARVIAFQWFPHKEDVKIVADFLDAKGMSPGQIKVENIEIGTDLWHTYCSWHKENISPSPISFEKFNGTLIRYLVGTTEEWIDLIHLLTRLKMKRWFRRVEGYEKQEFGVFLDEVCNISEKNFDELRYACIWYPEASAEYGPYTIQAIKKAVGAGRIPEVLKEIDAAVAETKEKGRKKEIVREVIARHRPEKKDSSESS